MEFNQLESFLKVVKYKSFSEAAKSLFLTQPTISNNIQNLERELGTVLLDRKSKTITLTDSGQSFYKYAAEMIDLREQAKYSIMDQSNNIEGEIEINASSIPEQYILPYIIRDFTKEYPDVTFSIIHKNSKDIVDDIIDGTQNFGIVGAKYPSKYLEYVDFYKDELVLAVPNSDKYTIDPCESLDLNKLFSEKHIFRKKGSGTRLLVESALSEKGINVSDFNIVYTIDSNEMIKRMIELELGISFISKLSIKNEIDLELIKSITVDGLNLKRNFYFVHSTTRTLSPLIETFKEFLINWKSNIF